jgi:hypothetical protein
LRFGHSRFGLSTFSLSRFGLSRFDLSRFGHSRFGHGFKNIYTLLVLLVSCGTKDRLDNSLKGVGIRVSFQWPKGSLAFQKKVHEKVEKEGLDRMTILGLG